MFFLVGTDFDRVPHLRTVDRMGDSGNAGQIKRSRALGSDIRMQLPTGKTADHRTDIAAMA